MGAWGTGFFENDSALDYMAALEETEYPVSFIRNALQAAVDADYLESDDASAAIVASAYVDNNVNGTRFSDAGDASLFPVDSFRSRYPNIQLEDLKPLAVAALAKVAGANSELRELWEESGALDDWQQGIVALSARLEG